VVADEGSAGDLGQAGAEVEVVHDGDELELGGLGVRVAGRDHAVVHPDVPVVPNVGYLVGGRLFHPGDALTLPGEAVEILAVPAGAPWLRLADAVDYLREVMPEVAVPVHERVLSEAGIAAHYGQLERLGARDRTSFGCWTTGSRWSCRTSVLRGLSNRDPASAWRLLTITVALAGVALTGGGTGYRFPTSGPTPRRPTPSTWSPSRTTTG
jgi:hypothetical protein